MKTLLSGRKMKAADAYAIEQIGIPSAARMLHLKGYRTTIFMAGREEKGTQELQLQLSIARRLGIPVKTWERMKEEPGGCQVLLDGLFGVGLSREIGGDSDGEERDPGRAVIRIGSPGHWYIWEISHHVLKALVHCH